ncbi:MAG: hypothetical protein ABIP48_04460 [Planctomycetota bacterium]
MACVSGCSTLDLGKGLSWPGSEPKPQTPVRLVNVWTDTVLQTQGQPGVRGFGGRVFFYAEKKDEPVVVDGTLTVYAFDDEDPNPDTTAPEKKDIFLPAQLESHYSKSKVGHSYSFWLPWDAVGGRERQISLLARFEDRAGRVVMSQWAHATLPGRKAPETPQAPYESTIGRLDDLTSGAVRQIAHEVPVDPTKKKEMTTATINLTPSFTQKLLAAASAEAETGDDDDGQEPQSAPPTATADPPAEPSDSARVTSQSGRFARRTLRAPGGASGGPTSAPARKEPRLARWPSPLPRTPRSGYFRSTSTTTPTDEPAPD